MSILIGILMITLVVVSLFLVLIVLMQRGSANGGLGAAMGGGAAESALGADSGNVLSRLTTKVAVVFFVMVLGLNLLILKVHTGKEAEEAEALPEFDVPAAADTNSAEDALNDAIQSAEKAAEGQATDAAEEAADSIPAPVEN